MKKDFKTYLSKDYPSFNLDGYFYQLIKNRTLVETPHGHDFFEIALFIKGSAAHNIDGEKHFINEGQFVFLNPNNVHYFEGQSDDAYVFSLSILSEKLAKFFSTIDYTPVFTRIYNVKSKRVIKEIERLPTMAKPRQKLIINTIITDLLTEAILSDSNENTNVPATLQIAIEKIRRPEHIGGGVENLAKLAGYSRMHLGRLTKAYYGKSPIGLLQDIKMSLATEYLEKTSFSVEKIAELVGLSSVSQFHSAFKRKFGCTPNAYRKQAKSDIIATI